MMHSEYRGFFYIGMITRNERNAIIQHGTMTLVRRQTLEDVGGWAEWCITEDAELGLRIIEHRSDVIYLPRSYGKGLMPDTLIDFKKQRFRWAFGAMQIMRYHWGALLGRSGLTMGQRYHFVAGWLPWLADGFNLAFNFTALAAVREEGLFMLSLWLAAYAVARYTPMNSPDAYLWEIMLLIQSVPYTASVLMAVISGFPKMSARLVGRSASMEETVLGILTKTGHGADRR